MKIHILSDLHLEFAPFEYPRTKETADAVVFAGDIHTGRHGLKWIREQRLSLPALYVLGNHEFYGQTVEHLIQDLKETSVGSGVNVLHNTECVIGGVRFLGATLWTDFELFHDQIRAEATAQLGMTDFRRIRVAPTYSRLRTYHTRQWHQQSVEWLAARLAEPSPMPTVVVTHHAPSLQSIPSRYRQDWLSPAFASNLEPLIHRYKPRLWIHGHIHDHADYIVGETRVIANPRGYPTEHHCEFDPGLIVEI